MFDNQFTNQSGFALLIFLVVMMGLGGIALTGVTQGIFKEVENQKIEHNRRVLQEAKQALLSYAYRYPSIPAVASGPGRLPCPDTNSSGTPNASFFCIDGGTAQVGRFPWNAPGMNFYNAQDASGNSLWYAVSQNFANTGPLAINSDTVGSITIIDQSGSTLYDGSVAGVAAIIIAPGAAINRDNDNNGTYETPQLRGTPLQQNNPQNYLDTINGIDNSSFVNASNAPTDGFILGPIRDLNAGRTAFNTIVVNDQIEIITADEILEMAEKATLGAYRDSINAYLTNTGPNNYPWLFDYDILDLSTFPTQTTTASVFPFGQLTNIGRIPSIFTTYFTDSNSKPIEARLGLNVLKQFTVSGVAYNLSVNRQSLVIPDITFSDLGDDNDNQGSITATFVAEGPYIDEVYLWDTLHDTVPYSGVFAQCPDLDGDGSDIDDCNRDAGGVHYVGPNLWPESRVLIVGISLDFASNIDLTYPPLPPLVYTAANAGGAHALVSATFSSANVTALPAIFYHSRGLYDNSGSGTYTESFGGQQRLTNDGQLPNDATPFVQNQNSTTIISMPYYPELPFWAHTDENDWHNSIMMAISPGYQPGAGNNCAIGGFPPCLTVSDIGGVTNDKQSLLVLAGEVNAFNDPGLNGFVDDLGSIFNPENANVDNTFLRREGNVNDRVMVIR